MTKKKTDGNEINKTATKPAKKRGSKSASLELNCTATNEEISNIIKNSLYWYDREPVKTDEECAERLNEFFKRIAETGEIPTVEKMALALGVTRKTLNQWENKHTLTFDRSSMIQKAKEILASLDAELVSRGKIPQITYIFRAKNYFGMTDTQQINLTASQPLGENLTEEEAAKKYQAALPDVNFDGE